MWGLADGWSIQPAAEILKCFDTATSIYKKIEIQPRKNLTFNVFRYATFYSRNFFLQYSYFLF
jgi:hypothetical protein